MDRPSPQQQQLLPPPVAPQQHQQHLNSQQHQQQQRLLMQRELAPLPQRAASLPPSVRHDSSRFSMQTIPNHLHQQQHQQQHRGPGASVGVGAHQTLPQQQPQQHEQQHHIMVEQQRQPAAECPNVEGLGAPYGAVAAPGGPRYIDVLQGPPGPSHGPMHSSFCISSISPVPQQQWQQHQQHIAMQMHQQMTPFYASPAFQDTMKLAGPSLRPTQLLPMRLLGDLRLYVPHREPFLGEGGSVHMYLLGKQVKHAVATDEAEECTQDILSLIQARQVPSDSTMPLLIHDGQVVCGGPEVCLRYLAKKLGQYGGDHLKDALLDRLLMDLNTWFNVQQAAIQSILSPDTLGKEAVSDYLKSRRHFYGEAEKLLAFFNSKHIGAPVVGLDGSLRAPGVGPDASMRGHMAPRAQPFFLGEEDSLADYFLFSLIDDDQRIAECLVSSSNSSSSSKASEGPTNGEGRERQQQQASTETETKDVAMHYFDETPHLHALYLALLNLPLIQEALLSSDVQDVAGAAIARDEATHDHPGEGKDRLGPCVATEASTTASVNDSPLQQLQRQQMMQIQQQQQQLLHLQQQQQQIKHLQQLGFTGAIPHCAEGNPAFYLRSTGGACGLPRTPGAAASLHTTLSGGLPCSAGACSFATGAGYMQQMLPAGPTLTAHGGPPYWQPLTPGTHNGHQGMQREDYGPYGGGNPGVAYQQQQPQQGAYRGMSIQQPYANLNLQHAASPQVTAGGDAGSAK